MTAATELPAAVAILSALSVPVAAVAIPLLLAVLGHRYTEALKDKEIRAQFVSLALDQLKLPPTKENQNLRGWAVEVVNRFSGVQLSTDAARDLVTSVPFGGSLAQKIFLETASVGRQLGVLLEAVVALSERQPPSWQHPAIDELRSLAAEVERMKYLDARSPRSTHGA